MEQMSRPEAVAIWRNGRVPVIFKPDKKEPILVRVPFATDNREWLLGSGRLIGVARSAQGLGASGQPLRCAR